MEYLSITRNETVRAEMAAAGAESYMVVAPQCVVYFGEGRRISTYVIDEISGDIVRIR